MLKLYNPLNKQKEIFKPLEKGKVKMYTCGPTVYDYASIGNMWSYLTADFLRRYLEYSGYEVRLIKNITDVGHFTDDEGVAALEATGEDKMEKAAKREKKTPLEIAEHYTKYYKKDEQLLNILPPHFQPRPTQEIDEIIKIVKELEGKGFAYETADGVYFSVEKFPEYGKLSGNTMEQIQAGARVEVNENKKNPADFALWIKRVGKNAKHSLHWDSPWGPGFPGWHIECTAMATKYLGDSLDIHSGGEDNIFPHHECEIAQSEAYTSKPFVKYWIHTRHFLFEGEKMSKSKGNVFTVAQVPDNRFDSLEKHGYSPLAFRILKLGAHYRSKANFTWEGMDQAQKNLNKINEFFKKVSAAAQAPTQNSATAENANLDPVPFLKRFESALDDDLNTPEALAVVLDFVKTGNKLLAAGPLQNPKEIQKALNKMDSVLAILEPIKKTAPEIPAKITQLAQQREKFRSQKDFQKADKIRHQIEAKGYLVIDKSGEKGVKFEIKKK